MDDLSQNTFDNIWAEIVENEADLDDDLPTKVIKPKENITNIEKIWNEINEPNQFFSQKNISKEEDGYYQSTSMKPPNNVIKSKRTFTDDKEITLKRKLSHNKKENETRTINNIIDITSSDWDDFIKEDENKKRIEKNKRKKEIRDFKKKYPGLPVPRKQRSTICKFKLKPNSYSPKKPIFILPRDN